MHVNSTTHKTISQLKKQCNGSIFRLYEGAFFGKIGQIRERFLRRFFAIFLLGSMTLPLMANTATRGFPQLAGSYRQHQRTQNFFMVTQPDVDSECRRRIHACLAEYCGDMTALPGQTSHRCRYASENDLFNWALLCLQRDRNPLLPQFATNMAHGAAGMNTAARLCPPYIQSELMAYLAMANMAEQLALRRSGECVRRRRELTAAISCHHTALMFGDRTQSRLTSELNNHCGPNMPGGSVEMVQRFATAGNMGANVFDWTERVLSGSLSSKGPGWEMAMDQVLAFYTNQMNLACGDNQQMVTPPRTPPSGPQFPTLTAVTAMALGANVPPQAPQDTPVAQIWTEVRSNSELWDFQTAEQVVHAGLTMPVLTHNAFLSSGDMARLQEARILGTRVVIIRDQIRCWIVPIDQMSMQEQSLIAQTFASCSGR